MNNLWNFTRFNIIFSLPQVADLIPRPNCALSNLVGCYVHHRVVSLLNILANILIHKPDFLNEVFD